MASGTKERIMVVDDDLAFRLGTLALLEDQGFAADAAANAEEAETKLLERQYDLVLSDLVMPGTSGIDLLTRIRSTLPNLPVIMVTGFGSIETVVEAIKLGATNFLTKPFELSQLMMTVDKALETTQLRREVRELRRQMQREFGIDSIIGRHSSMLRLFDIVKQVSRTGVSTVFLRGETGTGKDLVARVIHHNSERATSSFVNITCTALSETLLESELFGHERGAFTDAKLQKKGLLELADGGTVFLDEVGDMPAALQAKLLRFLEERRFRRVGGTQEIGVDVRVMAATNRDLEQAIEQGLFRRDLMYRLNVVTIYLPPLRARGDDLLLLSQHFISRFATEFKRPISKVTDETYERLRGYSWPGNVRELRNVLERAVLLCKDDTIRAEDIVLGPGVNSPITWDLENMSLPPEGFDLERLRQLEFHLLQQALQRTSNNQTQAAKLLNLSRDRLRYRLQKHGLL